LIFKKKDNGKRVLKERQTFQIKTPTLVNLPVKLTKNPIAISNKNVSIENNSAIKPKCKLKLF